MSDANVTRAPWAMRPISGAAVPNMSAPGAGASVTRAPWAVDAAGSAGAGAAAASGGDVGTRAPWSQGVSVGDPTMQDRLDFNAIARMHPDYSASLDAAAAASAAATAAAAAASPAAPAAATTATTAATAAPAATPIYSAPCKLIKTPAYMSLWRQTCAYAELTSFILLLNERVRGVKIAPRGQPSRKYSVSAKVRVLVEWLDESRAAIARIPPIQQSMRFGNKAFRVWHEERTSAAALGPMLRALLGPELVAAGAEAELVPYLQDSFGSVQRIDYGTGHELNFVLTLCALNKLAVFHSDDYVALVLEVFRAYILLMEELQSTYWLEPAGSKGAWGLDDYQFLIFLWGSSQLQGSTIQPADFLKEGVVESHGDSYLFLLGIHFINRMKRGPFHEHSSFLHHISTLPSWSKANGGLVKMYDAEVLAKHPIVQHVLFGRVLKFQRYDPATETLGVADAIREEEAKKEKAAARAAAMSAMAAPDNAAASAAIPTAADASNAPSDATSDK